MIDFLQYSFMQRAFVAGIVTAFVAPTIGLFFVVRRYSAMPDTIAHVSFAGLAASVFAGTPAIATALLVSILSVLGIEKMREKRVLPADTIVSLFLFGGLALAVVFIGLSRGKNINIINVLFGNILTVSTMDLWIIVSLGVVVLTTTACVWKILFAVSLDEEVARASGLPVAWMNRLLAVLGATVVAVSINVMGVLLIGAMMVIPVLAAMQWKRGFFHTWILAVCVSLVSVIIGLIASFVLNLPSGGAIVLVSIALFILFSFMQKTASLRGFM